MYGTLPLASEGRRGRKSLSNAVAYGVAGLGVACVCALALIAPKASTERSVLAQGDMFKTPGLKSLLGTFMKEQGASQKDIGEMNNYYKGSSKKSARVQQLSELGGEFDPISDADSNYGRVLDIKSASRTNGVVPEDMDYSPERKAPVQMLAMPGRFQTKKKMENMRKDQSRFGTNKAFINKMDGAGQSTKAKQQMLAMKAPPTNVWQQIGAPEPAQAAQGAMKSSDNFGYKAPVQMLAQKAPPTNVWQQIGAPEPAQAAQGAMKNSDNFGYKAPVQMLAQEAPPTNVWQQIGAPEPAQAAQGAMKSSDNFGYKAPVQMLTSIMGGPLFTDHPAKGSVPLPEAGAVGTDAAYMGYADGAGQSTKGRTSMLAMPSRFTAPNNRLPNAGTMGTNKAFLGKMDGAGQSTKARAQKLSELGGEFDPISDADSNYGRVLDIKSASRTNGVVPEDMDYSPERKAPVQMLYDIDGPQPTDAPYSSWKNAAKHNWRETQKDSSTARQIAASRAAISNPGYSPAIDG